MARAQNRLKRFVARSTWADNARITFDLPRDFDLESLVIRISGNCVNTVAWTAVRAEAPTGLIKFLSLKANGTDILDAIPGQIAHRLGMMRRGQLAPLTPPPGVTVATHAFAGAFVLDRQVVDGIRAKDGNFPTRGLSTMQLELQMGACADCYTGAGTGTITSGVVEVFGTYTAEEKGADGSFALPRVVTKRTHVDIPFPSSNTNYQHRLNTGNIMRGLLIRCVGAVTAGEPSDAILNNLKIMKGNQVLMDLSANAIRVQNSTDYELTTIPTGYYLVDFMQNGAMAGKLSDCLDLRDGAECFAYLDVTGGTNVSIGITTLEYIPYNARYWGLAA